MASTHISQEAVVNVFNPSTQEIEAGESLSSKLAWSTDLSSRVARSTQRNLVSGVLMGEAGYFPKRCSRELRL